MEVEIIVLILSILEIKERLNVTVVYTAHGSEGVCVAKQAAKFGQNPCQQVPNNQQVISMDGVFDAKSLYFPLCEFDLQIRTNCSADPTVLYDFISSPLTTNTVL